MSDPGQERAATALLLLPGVRQQVIDWLGQRQGMPGATQVSAAPPLGGAPDSSAVSGGTPNPNTRPDQQADPDQLAAFRKFMENPEVEGRRNDVYPDTLKNLTVGIGHRVLPGDNLKLGDVISDERVNQLFARDGSIALNAARKQAAEAGITDPNFLPYLASVNFQLGTGWRRDFKRTWPKIVAGDYAGAAQEFGRSLLAQQTPKRVQQFQTALLALPPKGGQQ
jgi:GH24 family phage-related lysozyme (muramidase)